MSSRRNRFIWTITLILGSVHAAWGTIPTAEHDALVAIYNATGGPQWTFARGWLGAAGTECSWMGVRCDASSSTVTGLTLVSNALSGSMPAELASLTNLQSIDLFGNGLTGPIPTELGSLTKLNTLDLRFNLLTGSIPVQVSSMPSLVTLDLGDNQLTGDIPPFGPAIRILALSDNNFAAGPIPDSLQSLALIGLGLESTNRTGDIPAWIATQRNLTFLDIGKNDFNPGPMPDYRDLTGLTELVVDRANRTGDFPAWLANLTQLEFLNLDFNPSLNAGPIPDLSGLAKASGCSPAFGNAPPCLQLLGLAETNRTGPIPDSLASLSNLEVLFLDDNHLTGSFPSSLTTLADLIEVCVEGNKLTGMLPDALAHLANLTNVDFRWNALQASGPTTTFVNALETDCDTVEYLQVDFRNTQTTAPRFGLSVTGATASSLTLHWNPIRYTADAGHYLLYMSASPSGPWTLAKRVPGGKTATQYTLSGLQRNTTYYFQLVTATFPHANNSNNVMSLAGPVFSGATMP